MFDEAGLMCYILGLRYWNSDDVRTLQSAELTASSLLSVLAASLHLPLVDTCWAKKGLIRDGKDTLSVERLYVYIVGLTCRVAWLSCDKQRTTFEGA